MGRDLLPSSPTKWGKGTMGTCLGWNVTVPPSHWPEPRRGLTPA